jgi:hypothetical protein
MVDLSAYGGISFDLWGDAGSSGMLTFQVSTSADSPPNGCSTNVGTCLGDASVCSPPSIAIPVPAAERAPLTVRWTDFDGGAPMAGVDPTQILGLSCSFGWAG